MDIIKVYINRFIDPIRILIDTLPTLVSVTSRNIISTVSTVSGYIVESDISIKNILATISRISIINVSYDTKFTNNFKTRKRLRFSTRGIINSENITKIKILIKALAEVFVERTSNRFRTLNIINLNNKSRILLKERTYISELIYPSSINRLGGNSYTIGVQSGFKSIFTGKFHVLGDFDPEELGVLDTNDIEKMDFDKI